MADKILTENEIKSVDYIVSYLRKLNPRLVDIAITIYQVEGNNGTE